MRKERIRINSPAADGAKKDDFAGFVELDGTEKPEFRRTKLAGKAFSLYN